MNWSAIARQKMKPPQAAATSNEGMVGAPSFCCTCAAHAGMGLSAVIVATMIMSISAAVSPAASSAARAACTAISLVTSPSAAT
jgi:hypothetical protein